MIQVPCNGRDILCTNASKGNFPLKRTCNKHKHIVSFYFSYSSKSSQETCSAGRVKRDFVMIINWFFRMLKNADSSLRCKIQKLIDAGCCSSHAAKRSSKFLEICFVLFGIAKIYKIWSIIKY